MYCEKLSEQLTVADSHARAVTTGATGATSFTGTAIDARHYNRIIAYSVFDVAKSATGVSWTIQWNAATVSGMTGSTTVTTCTGSVATPTANATTVVTCEISGEQVQANRVNEDRYLQAVVTANVKSAHAVGIDLLVLADAKRYHV
jgi:hypothetical protein